MASLNIDFSYDDNVKRCVQKAKRALSTRMADYAGIKKDLNNIYSPNGNLSTANTYIQKKINNIQSKYDNLERFEGAVKTFNDNAYEADKRVAEKINTEMKKFYKKENIQTGVIYSIGSVVAKGTKWLKGEIGKTIDLIKKGASSTWKKIKKWYEDNKYWVDLVIDGVCVVVAAVALIASGGALATVFAVWGLAKSVCDFVFDLGAYSAYKDGNMQLYEELSSGGLKNVMKGYLGETGEYLYYGMEIVSAIYDLYEIGKSISYIFTDYKKLYIADTSCSKILSASTKKQIIKTDIKLAAFEILGIKHLDRARGTLNLETCVKAVGWTAKTFKNVFEATSTRSFLTSSIGLVSSFDDLNKNGKLIVEKAYPYSINCKIDSIKDKIKETSKMKMMGGIAFVQVKIA